MNREKLLQLYSEFVDSKSNAGRDRDSLQLFVEWLQKRPELDGSRSFQLRVWDWITTCFQRPDAREPEQRAFRFIEEALELVQAIGTSREDVLRLVDYTYSRPAGRDTQEFGGVMVTLAGLAQSVALDLNSWAEAELQRCIANTEKIRSKDLGKPERSPLPGPTDSATSTNERAAFDAWLRDVQGLQSAWLFDRNCYKDFPAHLAWCAWQEAQRQAQPPSDAHQDRREDRSYYWGARQAAAMAHQSLQAMDDWIKAGCGGRGAVTKEATEPKPLKEPDTRLPQSEKAPLPCEMCDGHGRVISGSVNASGPPRTCPRCGGTGRQ